MAENLTRKGLNNQKRKSCFMVSEQLTGTEVAGTGALIGVLPDKSLILSVGILSEVASEASDTLDVSYGGAVVANEIPADNGTAPNFEPGTVITTAAYLGTGGDIIVLNGSQTVIAAWRGRVVVEYVELDLRSGEYTNYSVAADS